MMTAAKLSETNPSWVLHAPYKASIEQRPAPVLTNEHDAIVTISYIGVCGSDVSFYTKGGIGTKLVQDLGPTILGHEASGTVHSVGAAVTSVRPGDRVAIDPSRPCRYCRRCREGLSNMCVRMKFAACPPLEGEEEGTPGCLARYFIAPADMLHRVPERVGLQEAVLVEPLAVASHACRQLELGAKYLGDGVPGKTIVVCGAGTIGLCSAAVARAVGALSKIVLVDVVSAKLEFAEKWLAKSPGAGEVVTWKPGAGTPEENARRLIEECGLVDEDGTRGADAVIEASGAEPSVNMAVHVLRLGGSMVQAGLGRPTLNNFPIVEVTEKELHIHGAFRYKEGDFRTAMYVLEQGLVPAKELITQVFTFEEAPKAWEATRDGKGIKNMIQVEGCI